MDNQFRVNVVERAVVLSKSDEISMNDLPESIRGHRTIEQNFELPSNGSSLKRAMAEPERQLIVEALEANGWNRQNTARTLGINRTTLYKKMKKYQIEYEREKQLIQ